MSMQCWDVVVPLFSLKLVRLSSKATTPYCEWRPGVVAHAPSLFEVRAETPARGSSAILGSSQTCFDNSLFGAILYIMNGWKCKHTASRVSGCACPGASNTLITGPHVSSMLQSCIVELALHLLDGWKTTPNNGKMNVLSTAFRQRLINS